MFNLLKMDLYRLLRSKTTLIMVITTLLLGIFSLLMTSIAIGISTQAEESGSEASVVTDSGIVLESHLSWTIDSKIDFTQLLSIQLQGRVLLIVVAVFTVLYTAAEFKHGYIKNIAGQFPNRSPMAGAKLITLAVMILIIFFVFELSLLITGLVFFKDRLYLDSAAALLKLSFTQYLLHFAYACVIAFLVTLSRSSVLSITLGVLFAGGISDMLYSLFNQLSHNDQFNIAEYTLTGNIPLVTVDMSGNVMGRAVLVGCIFLTVFAALYALVVQKKDIN